LPGTPGLPGETGDLEIANGVLGAAGMRAPDVVWGSSAALHEFVVAVTGVAPDLVGHVRLTRRAAGGALGWLEGTPEEVDALARIAEQLGEVAP
jgi:hypothetical protein